MARPVGRPPRTAKQKLIEAMGELLSERGYTATSPKMVLEHAGLGQGSLYYHFTGKEALAVETVASLMDRSLAVLADEIAREATPPADASHETGACIDEVMGSVGAALCELCTRREGEALVRLLADPVSARPGPVADGVAVWVQALRLLLSRSIATPQPDEPLQADATPSREPEQLADRLLARALGDTLLRIGSGWRDSRS